MKKRLSLLCAVFLLPALGFSQGIRKNYLEMTESEQYAFRGALWELSNSNANQDIVQVLTQYYFDHYDDFYNSPCSSSQFLFFQRMMLWEMENAIQSKNPRLTIPYWDWRTDASTTSQLFTTFLNLENIPSETWGVWRLVGVDGDIPSASEMETVMGAYKFCDDDDYTNSFQRQAIYPMGYRTAWWVGGTLGMLSPSDPVFFLHHALIDKVWQDWQMTTWSSWSGLEVLDRYDGYTSGLYVSTLPYTNPNSIVDSRSTGIFYAADGVANLDGSYFVQNTYLNPEQFSYQYQINATDFIIPYGKNAVFTSKTGVTLGTGFLVDGGTLEIDVGPDYDNFPLAKKGVGGQSFKPKNVPFAPLEDKLVISRSSTGFTAHLSLQSASDVEGYLMGIDGKIVSRLQSGHLEAGIHNIEISAPQTNGSLYYGYFRVGKQTYKQLLPKL